jgi:hypothetical protein
MSDTEADDEDPLDRAIAAATRVLEDETVDAAEEEALWQRLVIEVFAQQLRLDDDADTFVAMTNARLERNQVPFRVVRVLTR